MIGITERYQFPLYHNRAEFKAASGMEAPAFRTDRPIKQWFDPAGIKSYKIWDGSVTEPKLVDLIMTAEEAKAVNLPGHPDFPTYTPAPTPATFTNRFGSFTSAPRPVTPSDLSTKSQADSLAALVGATVVEASSLNQFVQIAWNGETRRDYILQYKGQGSGPTVGSLLVSMYAAGVGAPGHWSASQVAAGQLVWVPEIVDDGSGNHPVMEIPLALLPDEELYSVPLGVVATVAIRKKGTGSIGTTGSGDVLAAITDLKAYLVNKMGV